MKQQRSKHLGFTLVELLVVIGIIALLIGILLPTLARARKSAKGIACLSNERQILLAILSYTNENDGHLPGPCIGCINDPAIVNSTDGTTVSQMSQWENDTYSADRSLSNINLLQRYVGGIGVRDIWRCPASTAMWDNASPYSSTSAFYGRKLGYGYLVNNTSQTKSTKPAFLFGTYNKPANQPTE